MTNYENRKSEIEPITRMGLRVAVDKDTNEIHVCGGFSCSKCLFGPVSICHKKTLAWADAECIETAVDWTKVPVDTPILVKDLEWKEWSRRYFSHYENGRVYTFADGLTSWTSHDDWKDWNYAKLAEADDGI